MSTGITLHLRFFASVRERLGCSEERVILPVDVKTVGQVRQWLMARGGVWADTLAHGLNLRMAYQLEMCGEAEEITEDGELAFFPPVTGG